MMDIRRLLLLATCVLVPLSAPGHAAAGPGSPPAAPERTDSDPAPDSHVAKPPSEVSITFSEPVDPSSGMQVLDECGKRIDDRNVTVELMTMRVGISDGPRGHYIVEYLARSVNGLTGDTRGRFHFIVDSGTPCSGAHGDHGDHGDPEPPDHNNHGDDDDGDADHSGGDHQGKPGTHGDNGGRAHDGDHRGSGDHRRKNNGPHGDHEGEGHDDHPVTPTVPPSPPPTLGPAAAPSPPTPPPVDRGAVLTALALAGLVGTLGGWMLRVESD